MGDLALALIISGILLAYVSVLLYIRLGALGLPLRRVRRLLAEFWVVYLLVIGLFSVIRLWLGEVLPEQDITRQLLRRWLIFRALPFWQQATIVGMLLAALVLIVHFIRSLRAAQQLAVAADTPETEE